MRYALALTMLAVPGAALAKNADPAAAICAQPVRPPLFVSPMGEPFRPGPDGIDPVKRWFDQADRDHDGKLTIGEMMLDGDRFFATLDTDHNGELLPDEVDAYEEAVLPEVRLYQRRAEPSTIPDRELKRERDDMIRRAKEQRRGTSGYGGAIGAGRFSFLNIPNPVASADDDINRAVSKAEFRSAAAERFRDLDPAQKKHLTLAELPNTPAQIAANADCIARVKADASSKRRSRQ